MNARDVINGAEGVVEMAVPQARAAKWIGYAILAVVALALAGAIFWWFFVRPANLAHNAAQSRADASMAQAGQAAATNAVQVQVLHDKEIRTIETVVTKGEANVHAAAGADASSPAVAAAMHDALCMSASYQSEPDCAALRRDRGSLGAAGPDAGGGPPRQ